MTTWRRVCSVGLLMFGAGCAGSNRADVPILSTPPTRPYHVIGYISTRGGKNEAEQKARTINADALILVSVNPLPEQSAPPPTIHVIDGRTIKVGGAPASGEIHRQTYMAIQWLSAARTK